MGCALAFYLENCFPLLFNYIGSNFIIVIQEGGRLVWRVISSNAILLLILAFSAVKFTLQVLDAKLESLTKALTSSLPQ